MTIQQTEGGSVIRSLLLKEFTKAKRNGTLFRIAHHVSGFVYLALRLKVRFVSLQLMKAAVAALKTLKETGNAGYASLIRGMRIAWAFSEAAVSWGRQEARGWRNDMSYIHYLSMNLESA